MKINRTSKTRLYASMLCLLFLIGGAVLLLYTSLSITGLEKIKQGDTDTPGKTAPPLAGMISTWKHLNLGIAIGCGAGFAFSFLLFLGSFRSRLGKYMRIIERLDFSDPGPLNLAALRFPDEDEFGNLGQRLNRLIERLETFDRMKGDKVRIAMALLRELGRHTQDAIAVINPSFQIIFASETCSTLFGIKEFRENLRMTAAFKSEALENAISSLLAKKTAAFRGPLELELETQLCRCDTEALPILNSEYVVDAVFLVFGSPKFSKKK